MLSLEKNDSSQLKIFPHEGSFASCNTSGLFLVFKISPPQREDIDWGIQNNVGKPTRDFYPLPSACLQKSSDIFSVLHTIHKGSNHISSCGKLWLQSGVAMAGWEVCFMLLYTNLHLSRDIMCVYILSSISFKKPNMSFQVLAHCLCSPLIRNSRSKADHCVSDTLELNIGIWDHCFPSPF